MKKYPFVNRIMALALCVALTAGTPISAYAENIEAEENTVEILSEGIEAESLQGEETAVDLSEGDENINSEYVSEENAESKETEEVDEDSDDEQPEEEDADEEIQEFEAKVDGYTFKATCPKTAFDGEVEFSVSAIKLTEEQKQAAEETLSNDLEVVQHTAFDVCFIVDGVETEPTETVQLSVEAPELANIEVVHIKDSGDAENVASSVNEDEQTIDFALDEFSTIDMISTQAATAEPTKIGTITWSWVEWFTNYKKIATVYAVDENGNGITLYNSYSVNERLSGNGYNLNRINNGNGEASEFVDYFEKLAPTVNGYTYKGTYNAITGGESLYNISYNSKGSNTINYWHAVYAKNAENKEWNPLFSDNNKSDNASIYMVYESNEKPVETKYFTANLFNYEMNYVNSKAKDSKNVTKDEAVLFHNGGGDIQADVQKYYNKKWNICDTVGDSYGNATAYQDIVKNNLENNSVSFNYKSADIFNPNSDLFKSSTSDATKAYKNVSVPFIKDSEGYYVLDSTIDGQSGGTYGKYNKYVFNKNENKLDRSSVYGNSAFMPFGDSDYHFGMDLQVYFNINENGCVDADNSSSKHTKFEFAGDDDVWIFIDGKLALDMGGVHQTVNGDIDFATGTCTVRAAYNESKGVNRSAETRNLYTDVLGYSSVEEGRKALAQGGHTLSVFYLERGAGQSNCKIKFNFANTEAAVPTDIVFDKVDEQDAALEGAEFALYASTDVNCEGTPLYTATSGKDGKVTFKSVNAGTYFMKETKAPVVGEGADAKEYILDESTYTVVVTNGKKVINEGQVTSVTPGTFKIYKDVNPTDITEDTPVITKIVNKERKVNKSITVTKIWDDLDNEFDTRPDSLQIALYAKITVDGVDKYITTNNNVQTAVDTQTAYLTYNLSDNDLLDGSSNIWKHKFEELPAAFTYEGKTYSVTWSSSEAGVDNYRSTYSGSKTKEEAETAENHYKSLANAVMMLSSSFALDSRAYSLESTNEIMSLAAYDNYSDSYYYYPKWGNFGHIDINPMLNAKVYIDGNPVDAQFSITTSDANCVTVSCDGQTITPRSVTTSVESDGTIQVRLNGSFASGTYLNPKIYNVTVAKNISVTYNGKTYTVPVKIQSSVNYWSDYNTCPKEHSYDENKLKAWKYGYFTGGTGNNDLGIDFSLATGSGSTDTYGTLSIQKTVSGVALDQDKTFEFVVKKDGAVYGEHQFVTVKAGETSANVWIARADFGSYSVEEVSESAQLEGYGVETTYSASSVTLSAESKTASIEVVNTYTENEIPEEPPVIEAEDEYFYFVNTLTEANTYSWYVEKHSRSTGATLAGAVYGLYTYNGETLGSNPIYTSSTSDENGRFGFENVYSGNYVMKEIVAPNGYSLSEDKFYITVSANGQISVELRDGNERQAITVETSINQNESYMAGIDASITVNAVEQKFVVTDVVLYSLPNTGGAGVYLYILGGILLMIVGVLLLYKNNKKNNKDN